MTVIIHCILLAITCAYTHGLPTISTDPDDLISSACFSQSEKVLRLSCDPGHMINLRAVYYGHSNDGACNYTQGDCFLADDQEQTCSGQRSCDINLPSGELGRNIPHCGQRSTYIQAHYTCVPASQVYDICEHRELTHESGYITTPRYPNNYPPGRNCTLRLLAHTSQTIALRIIDLDLGVGAGGNCTDWLYVQTQLRAQTLCGKRQQEAFIETLHDNKMAITFHSNNQGQNKGFWLYYQASPPLPPPTAPPPDVSTAAMHTPGGSTEGEEVSGSPPGGATKMSKGREGSLSIEGIVGGVMGTLLFILLIILILLIIKRRKERPLCGSSSASDLSSSKSAPSSSLQGYSGPYIQNDLTSPGAYSTSDKLFNSV